MTVAGGRERAGVPGRAGRLSGRLASGSAREAEEGGLCRDGQLTGLGEAGVGDPASGPAAPGVFF